MKQKLVIRLSLECEKRRKKAFKIVSDANGVSSVALEGEHKDKVVVIGETLDSVCLGRALKKKFRRAIIESVEEVKEEKKEEKKEEEKKEEEKEEEKEEKLLPCYPWPPWWHPWWHSYPSSPPPILYGHECDHDSFCIVM